MPIWILSVAPTPNKKRIDWYFNNEHEFATARDRAVAVDPYVTWGYDYLSEAEDFIAWLDKERECASD